MFDDPARKSDLVDLALHLHGESKGAFLLSEPSKRADAQWCPKSQVENNGDGTFAFPEWLAKDKGFA
jgi:hypothetical protein